MSDQPKPPQAGPKDVALGLTRAALSAIPVVGGSAVELLALILKPPIERRRNEFLSDLAARLAALEAAGLISLSDLSGNEEFTDNVLQATLAALRTRHQEKRQALRNAVLNALLPNAPDVELQELLISLIDGLLPWHLALLTLLAKHTPPPPPPGTVTLHFAGQEKLVSQLVEESFPAFREERELYRAFLSELAVRGLASFSSPPSDPGASPVSMASVTVLGKRLLRFVAEPLSPTGSA